MITKIYDPGFDDKILSVYMTDRSVTTGTAHPCVAYVCGAFDDGYCDSSVWVCVRKSATGAALCMISCALLTYSIGARLVVT